MINLELNASWNKYLLPEFKKEYFKDLQKFLKIELEQGKIIYPQGCDILNAFKSASFKKVKVVIIGQDPYHGEGQAHGLSFSVTKGTKVPPSLKNIYKELKTDLNIEPTENGNLQYWADQGVLLLNSVLTVEKGLPASHRKKGWEVFTDKVIQVLNDEKEHLVFILWGNDAKKKGEKIDRSKHLVLESAHPSPFSVKKFYGGKHFSKTNKFLLKNKIKPINW
ncbi:MAG: uracil-DNA glycosylase [Halobacteriovoraceae bacterium]|jgi:uracil-DNA glycosylase|nr:uracil-DNA glycosylase [Halobacteriovoraceae bacterium]